MPIKNDLHRRECHAMNKTLVLDVGGVLASNLTPGLWEQLASIGSCDQKHLYADYKEEVSEKLWCGQISEEQWWEWLSDRGVIVAEEQRSNLITNHLKPLPALELLPAWSQRCDIVIMSNHRTERSEEHTSELQSRENLVCRLLLEKKNKN